MNDRPAPAASNNQDRREFLRTSSLIAAGSLLASGVGGSTNRARAAGEQPA